MEAYFQWLRERRLAEIQEKSVFGLGRAHTKERLIKPSAQEGRTDPAGPRTISDTALFAPFFIASFAPADAVRNFCCCLTI